MTETPADVPLDAGELMEQLSALRARFGELRGRL